MLSESTSNSHSLFTFTGVKIIYVNVLAKYTDYEKCNFIYQGFNR